MMTSSQGDGEQLSRVPAIVFGIFGIFTSLDASEASDSPLPSSRNQIVLKP